MTNRHRFPRFHRIRPVITLAAIAASAAGCLAPDAVPGGQGGSGEGGAAGSWPGYAPVWVQSHGDGPSQRAFSIAAAPDGGALVAGQFEGALPWLPVPDAPAADGFDAFVAFLDADGAPRAGVVFGGVGNQQIRKALPVPGGGALVAGSFTDQLLVGDMDLSGAPENIEGFVAQIAEDGAVTWLLRVDGPGDQAVYSIDRAASGEIVLAGDFQGPLRVGDLPSAETADGADYFVAKLTKEGTPLWATSLGAGLDGDIGAPLILVAAAPGGGVHVAGTFRGTVRLGSNIGAVGERDLFLGKLDAAGTPEWGRAAGTPDSALQAAGLAVSGAGLVALSAQLRGEARIDKQTTLVSDGPETDAILLVYGDMGNVLWARRYGSPARDVAGPVAFDPDGNILFAGRFRGSISFGEEGVLQHPGAQSGDDDLFVATLTPGGSPLASAAFGAEGDQLPASIASTAEGDVLLGGWFNGRVDFGQGELDSGYGDDMFAVKLRDTAP